MRPEPNSELNLTHEDDVERVLTTAALRAAKQLDMTNQEFARVIGVSSAFVTKLRKSQSYLSAGSKHFELATHFVRLFRSLDAMVGGDEPTARKWLRNHNVAFGTAPIQRIERIDGLLDCVAYLDQMRAEI